MSEAGRPVDAGSFFGDGSPSLFPYLTIGFMRIPNEVETSGGMVREPLLLRGHPFMMSTLRGEGVRKLADFADEQY